MNPLVAKLRLLAALIACAVSLVGCESPSFLEIFTFELTCQVNGGHLAPFHGCKFADGHTSYFSQSDEDRAQSAAVDPDANITQESNISH